MVEPPRESAVPKPVIGLPACVWPIEDQEYHMVGAKYLHAAVQGAGGIPVILPSLDSGDDRAAMIARLDGLLVTGSPTNVAPDLYGGAPSAPGTRHDPARDAAVLPLIRAALDAGLPLFAICRGFQELNVVLGGTLHQTIQDLPGHCDHRAPAAAPLAQRYAPAHRVRLAPGGLLAGLAAELVDGDGAIMVNSLHAQGVDRLAPGLAVEATAEDGLVEAARVVDAATFALGVQWHPEWRPPGRCVAEDPFSRRIFAAFGDAARARAAARRVGGRAGGWPSEDGLQSSESVLN